MKAYVFPGQGAQFSGMGLDLYKNSSKAKSLFEHANQILGFEITKTMFEGSAEDLKQTDITQPAIFLHSVILSLVLGESFKPDMVAGHSLGEFSALVANQTLSFEDGLKLVHQRAKAMQEACEVQESTMAAVIGLDDEIVEQVCEDTPGIVVPANYNCPGQLVISGEVEAVNAACKTLKDKGAKRALVLPVGGAFHSPLMAPAKEALANAIENTAFNKPICPVYQNVNAKSVTNPDDIKQNLIEQLTSAVRWTQIMRNMLEDGMTSYTEVGPGKVLQGLLKKIDRAFPTDSASI
jgi:[acyl-carrier-protein] S-malonyltransferase